jgi:nucleotide-binding universal stress UspA family protein
MLPGPALGAARSADGRPAAFRAAAEHRVAETTEWQRRLKNIEDYAVATARVRSWVVRGRPASAVLEAAMELDSDAILIGSRGLGAMRGRLLGSVSSQVVEHARWSVMVFPARVEGSPARIASVVVGVDGSPGAAPVIAAGAALGSAHDARLVLMAVREHGRLDAELRHDAEHVLAQARDSVPAGIEVVEDLREGSPREMLIEAGEHFGPSVLVVGTHGLDLDRFVVGAEPQGPVDGADEVALEVATASLPVLPSARRAT